MLDGFKFLARVFPWQIFTVMIIMTIVMMIVVEIIVEIDFLYVAVNHVVVVVVTNRDRRRRTNEEFE